MIKEFVEMWEKNKAIIRSELEKKHPDEYIDLVKLVITNITSVDEYSEFNPDPERINQIDHGNYQGTLLFIIAAKGYQPSDFFFVKVQYGSCSGCDTLQSIRKYSDEKPNEEQVDDYMTLCLHIVQGLKKL